MVRTGPPFTHVSVVTDNETLPEYWGEAGDTALLFIGECNVSRAWAFVRNHPFMRAVSLSAIRDPGGVFAYIPFGMMYLCLLLQTGKRM